MSHRRKLTRQRNLTMTSIQVHNIQQITINAFDLNIFCVTLVILGLILRNSRSAVVCDVSVCASCVLLECPSFPIISYMYPSKTCFNPAPIVKKLTEIYEYKHIFLNFGN